MPSRLDAESLKASVPLDSNTPGTGNFSSASSSTAIPAIASASTRPPSEKAEDKSHEGDGRHKRGAEGDEDEDEEEVGSVNQIEVETVKHRSRWQSIFLVMTCTTAMILNIASGTSASIALPSIGRDFGVPEDNLQWVVSAFSLSSGCLLIFFGRLADLHGRKRAFLLGSLWTAAFSLGCGFANNIVTLDVLRGLQGLGPAAIVPASLGILAHAFPPSRARSLAFATFSAGAPVGGAVGLQLGGILTQWAPSTWRAPFFLSAGLAVLVFIGGLATIVRDIPSTEKDKRVDWIGAALVTTALVLITFVLGEGELAPKRWKTPYIIALLVVGVILLLVFLGWQYYLEHEPSGKSRPPLMKLSLWTRAEGKFAVMQSIAFLEWSAFMSWTFWAQLYYQDFQRIDPVLTAIRFLPMFVTGVLCNLVVALVIGHVDVVILVICGTLLTGVACVLFAVIVPFAPYWAFGFPAAVASVFGADFVFASGTLFVARVSLPHEQSLAGALFQTLTQLGTAFGLAITTIVHNSVLRRDAAAAGIPSADAESLAPRDAQLSAYHAAHWAGFAFAALGALLAAIFLRGVGVIGDRRKHAHPPPETADGDPEKAGGDRDETRKDAKKAGAQEKTSMDLQATGQRSGIAKDGKRTSAALPPP